MQTEEIEHHERLGAMLVRLVNDYCADNGPRPTEISSALKAVVDWAFCSVTIAYAKEHAVDDIRALHKRRVEDWCKVVLEDYMNAFDFYEKEDREQESKR